MPSLPALPQCVGALGRHVFSIGCSRGFVCVYNALTNSIFRGELPDEEDVVTAVGALDVAPHALGWGGGGGGGSSSSHDNSKGIATGTKLLIAGTRTGKLVYFSVSPLVTGSASDAAHNATMSSSTSSMILCIGTVELFEGIRTAEKKAAERSHSLAARLFGGGGDEDEDDGDGGTSNPTNSNAAVGVVMNSRHAIVSITPAAPGLVLVACRDSHMALVDYGSAFTSGSKTAVDRFQEATLKKGSSNNISSSSFTFSRDAANHPFKEYFELALGAKVLQRFHGRSSSGGGGGDSEYGVSGGGSSSSSSPATNASVTSVCFAGDASGTFYTTDGRTASVSEWHVTQAHPVGVKRPQWGRMGGGNGGEEGSSLPQFPSLPSASSSSSYSSDVALMSLLAVSPRWWLMASRNGSVCFYDCALRRPLLTTPAGHAETVFDVKFSHTEKNSFASCSYDGTIRLWSARHMGLIKTIDAFSLSPSPSMMNDNSQKPSASTVTAASTMESVSGGGAPHHQRIGGGGGGGPSNGDRALYALDWSPCGRYIVVGMVCGGVACADTVTGRWRWENRRAHSDVAWRVLWHKYDDGTNGYANASDGGGGGGSGTERGRDNDGAATAAAKHNTRSASPPSSFIFVASRDSKLSILSGADGRCLKTIAHPRPVFGVDADPFYPSRIVTGCFDSVVRVIDLEVFKGDSVAASGRGGGGGGFFSSSSSSSATLPPAGVVELRGHTLDAYNVAFSPLVEGLVASGSNDCTVRVWRVPCPPRLTASSKGSEGASDVNTCTTTNNPPQCIAVLEGHTDKVRALAWSLCSPGVLMSGGWDGSIRVWHVDGCGGDGAQAIVDLTNTSGEVAVGTAAAANYRCVVATHHHASDVYALAAHPHRPFVVLSGSRDTTIRLWALDCLGGTAALRGIGRVFPSLSHPSTPPPQASASQQHDDGGRYRSPTPLISSSSSSSPVLAGRFIDRLFDRLGPFAAPSSSPSSSPSSHGGHHDGKRQGRRRELHHRLANFIDSFAHPFGGSDLAQCCLYALDPSAHKEAASARAMAQMAATSPTRRRLAATIRNSKKSGGAGDDGGDDNTIGASSFSKEEQRQQRGEKVEEEEQQNAFGDHLPFDGAVVPTDVLLDVAEAKAKALAALVRHRVASAAGTSQRAAKLRAAAEAHLFINDVETHCELLVEAGDWDRALAAAPAVSTAYWRSLCLRAADHHQQREQQQQGGTAGNGGFVDERRAASLLICAQQGHRAADIFAGLGDFSTASVIVQKCLQMQNDCDDQDNVPSSPSPNRTRAFQQSAATAVLSDEVRCNPPQISATAANVKLSEVAQQQSVACGVGRGNPLLAASALIAASSTSADAKAVVEAVGVLMRSGEVPIGLAIALAMGGGDETETEGAAAAPRVLLAVDPAFPFSFLAAQEGGEEVEETASTVGETAPSTSSAAPPSSPSPPTLRHQHTLREEALLTGTVYAAMVGDWGSVLGFVGGGGESGTIAAALAYGAWKHHQQQRRCHSGQQFDDDDASFLRQLTRAAARCKCTVEEEVIETNDVATNGTTAPANNKSVAIVGTVAGLILRGRLQEAKRLADAFIMATMQRVLAAAGVVAAPVKKNTVVAATGGGGESSCSRRSKPDADGNGNSNYTFKQWPSFSSSSVAGGDTKYSCNSNSVWAPFTAELLAVRTLGGLVAGHYMYDSHRCCGGAGSSSSTSSPLGPSPTGGNSPPLVAPSPPHPPRLCWDRRAACFVYVAGAALADLSRLPTDAFAANCIAAAATVLMGEDGDVYSGSDEQHHGVAAGEGGRAEEERVLLLRLVEDIHHAMMFTARKHVAAPPPSSSGCYPLGADLPTNGPAGGPLVPSYLSKHGTLSSASPITGAYRLLSTAGAALTTGGHHNERRRVAAGMEREVGLMLAQRRAAMLLAKGDGGGVPQATPPQPPHGGSEGGRGHHHHPHAHAQQHQRPLKPFSYTAVTRREALQWYQCCCLSPLGDGALFSPY